MPNARKTLKEIRIRHDASHSFRLGRGKYWLTLTHGKNVVEGKLFLPQENGREVIVFHPGLAGTSTRWFEQTHVTPLLKAGFAVFCMRHNGSLAGGEEHEEYINCAPRVHAAKELGRYLGGNRNAGISDWALEPVTAVHALKNAFSRIHIIGHSFGGLATVLAIARLGEKTRRKIGTWIGMAPGLFVLKDKRRQIQAAVTKTRRNRVPGLRKGWRKEWNSLSLELEEQKHKLRKPLKMLAYYPEGDEYITDEDLNGFINSLSNVHRTVANLSGTEASEKWPQIHHAAFAELDTEELIKFVKLKTNH